jgi:predicted metal-dependent hydrolase
METNYLDTSCPKCHQKHTGQCLDWEKPKLTVESVIEEFSEKITSCSHVGGFHTCVLDDPKDNETYKQIATDWLKEKLTTLQTQHREEVEEAIKQMGNPYDIDAMSTFHAGYEAAKIDIKRALTKPN